MTTSQAADLNGIASILVDQIRLYGRAAELSKEPVAKASILEVNKDRALLLGEVRRELIELGEADGVHGTLLGASHKAFLDARAVVDNDTHAAIREVLRGEDYLQREVEKILEHNAPTQATKVYLQKFLASIRPGHDAIAVIHAQMH